MIPPEVYQIVRSGKSVSLELARNPDKSPSTACKELFGYDIEDDVASDENPLVPEKGSSDLQQALECGNWGESKPSELFLRIYHDVLNTLSRNPLIGVCSPSLLGTHGVCPLTIISTIPDIARHVSNIIARAEHEVFLATNFWAYSEPSRLITNGLRELSRKAVERDKRVVVKIIYDRGNPKQVLKNHQTVGPETYSDENGKIRIPHPDELPNVDLEVINFHRPIFGTFHSKYMVVDRRLAIVQSNNIQDNDNLEMMNQFEGPIVDSLYDTALISWHNAMKPPLPCLNSPAASVPPPSFDSESYASLFDEKGNLVPVYQSTSPVPVVPDGDHSLSAIASHGSTLSLPQHTSEDPNYDPDIASEVLRAASNLNPIESERRIDAVTRLLNTTIQPDTVATAPDLTPPDTITPLIPHRPHRPFPMALVNREPFGAPTHSSLNTPQNAAFFSAMRHCSKSIYIQTPDLNASDLLPEIVSAVRRGVHVSYVYCLGYNDAGEMLPAQGGHNEYIAHKLYMDLEEKYHDNLDIYAYVAKDQTRPIHNSFKKRSCHIKLMIVDGHIGIQGNGNQDSQSWYHSQETNVLVDSEDVVGRWMEGIRQNQNTFKYGKVKKGKGEMAGCWVDENGQMAEGSVGVDAGRFAWARGVVGAVQRVRGLGGF